MDRLRLRLKALEVKRPDRTGLPNTISSSSVSTKVGRERRFKGKLLPAGGRGGYRWCRGPAGGTCQKGILHALGLCRAESGKDVLQKLVGGLMLTFHLIHGGFDGVDTVHVDQLVLDHIRGRHGRGLVVGRGAGEGIFRWSSFGGGGVR